MAEKKEKLKMEIKTLRRQKGGMANVGHTEMMLRTSEQVKRNATIREKREQAEVLERATTRVITAGSPTASEFDQAMDAYKLKALNDQFAKDQKYKDKYIRLCAFLQNYREKMLLTKKVH
jgi:hypothetical protein